MKVVIEVPGELPGLNELINASKSRNGQRKYNEIKKMHTNAIGWMVKGKGQFKRIHMDITYYCKDKMKDPDNIMGGGQKIILDGLVAGGMIENDGWKQIDGISSRCVLDKKNPRIVIKIEEVSEC